MLKNIHVGGKMKKDEDFVGEWEDKTNFLFKSFVAGFFKALHIVERKEMKGNI